MPLNFKRQLFLALFVLISAFLTYQLVASLSQLRSTENPEIYLTRAALALAGFSFPILAGWWAYGFSGGLFFVLFASALALFTGTVSASSVFVWFLLEYAILCWFLYRWDQAVENDLALLGVDLEKYQNDTNDLQASYQLKGEGISVLFEKYSTYYNLRKLAEELATTLSLEKLGQIITGRSIDFFSRGDAAILKLSMAEGKDLEVVAVCRTLEASRETPLKIDEKSGDTFDLWVIKNRRRLIVADTQQDFRFDPSEMSRQTSIRGIIIAPLFQQGHVVGTLRIQSQRTHLFTNDDLRLLDSIAVLASSALSNALLYEKTQELAIRDSLTGLYTRRYFFERFREEHQRVLTTRRPISLFMCDVDHFKECNDRYGHAVGDLVLVHCAEIFNKLAENALTARYGGEEFAVLLPETSKQEAILLAERLCKAVASQPFVIRRESIRVTVSIGVSGYPDDSFENDELLIKADQALYQAKHLGRNRVCCA